MTFASASPSKIGAVGGVCRFAPFNANSNPSNTNRCRTFSTV
jgi:hypothetical protein